MPSTHKPLSALADYQHWLSTIKQRVVSARIVERETHAQWGSGFIDAFSKDLRQACPDIGGFSSKNLRYCRAFFRFYCTPAIWQQAVAKLTEILPDNLKGALPTVEEIEQDLQQLQEKPDE